MNDAFDFVSLLWFSLGALVVTGIAVPILFEILAGFGITVRFKPKLGFEMAKPDRASRLSLVLGLLSVAVVLSWIFNVGWIRILFGIGILIHFFLFRWLSWYLLKVRKVEFKLLMILLWSTFAVGYLLLPDFGDTEYSFGAFFGLVRGELATGIMLWIAVALLVANVGLMIYGLATNVGKKPVRTEDLPTE